MNTDSNASLVSNDDSNPRLGRAHTSPRTNAFNSVLALIDAQLATPGIDDASFGAPTALRTLREKVSALIGTKHGESEPKGKPGRPRTKEDNGLNGAHFVGVSNNGVPSYVHGTDFNPTDYMAVYGPFNTKAGSLYAIEHNTFTSKKQVF